MKNEKEIKARLFFKAVLPALPELLGASDEARTLLTGGGFSVAFSLGELRTVLVLDPEKPSVSHSPEVKADIELRFLTTGKAVATFENRPALPPLPLRGLTKLGQMGAFKALAQLLEEKLRPEEPPVDEAAREAFFGLSLGVGLRGVAALPPQECPAGTVVFQLNGGRAARWLRLGAEPASGVGQPKGEADAVVTFMDLETAMAALMQRLDAMCAVNAGRIRIEGHVPLADHVNHLMESVDEKLSKEKT